MNRTEAGTRATDNDRWLTGLRAADPDMHGSGSPGENRRLSSREGFRVPAGSEET